jgi:hypothetical protein
MPTPRFGLPFIAQGQAQKEVTHNDALIQLDALVDLFILDRNLAAPPGSPVDGDTYLVAASPTGAWAGQAGKLAYSVDGAWRFYSPLKGLIAYVADEQAILIYTGSSWVDWGTLLSFQNLPMLGVNTTADTTNKLAAKTNAVLFDALRAANGGNGDIRSSSARRRPVTPRRFFSRATIQVGPRLASLATMTSPSRSRRTDRAGSRPSRFPRRRD